MKNDVMLRLKSVNPVTSAIEPPAGLLEQILASPRPQIKGPSSRGRTWWTRPSRLLVALAAVLVFGVGVTWAATDKIPSALLLGHDLGEGLTAGKMDETIEGFSVLKPADDESIANLPDEVLVLLQARARPIIPPPPIPEDYEIQYKLDPTTISAIGETETDPGGQVTVYEYEGRICAVWTNYRGGTCDTPEAIRRGESMSGGHLIEGEPPIVFGLVDDRVKSIRIEDTNFSDEPVKDNVFEITGLPETEYALVGLDEAGNELFRVTHNRNAKSAESAGGVGS